MSDKKRILESLFHKALEIESPDERTAFLNQQCGKDQELRSNIEKMLSAHADVDGFLDQTRASSSEPLIPESLGTKIGRYKLLQVIGEGGMGVVYMAQQQEPVQRRVALSSMGEIKIERGTA